MGAPVSAPVGAPVGAPVRARGPVARLRRSLSLRLLAIFVLTGALLAAVTFGLLREGLSAQWRRAIGPHLERYVEYTLRDLGDPPRLERARAIAASVPVEIALYRDGLFVGATDDRRLPLERMRFRPPGPRRFHDARGRAAGDVEISGDRRGPILRVRRGAWDVYFRLDSRSRARGYADEIGLALGATGLVLFGSWLAIRRQLRPVGRIAGAVERMRGGELDARTGLSGDDDLATLGASVDAMAARLSAMLDAKRELLLAVSHELRSPIARARVALELLPAGKARTRLRTDLIEMQALVDGLLETERLAARHDVLSLGEVDLASLVSSVLAAYRDRPDVRLRADVDASTVLGDEARLRVMIRNLVENAAVHGRGTDGLASLDVALSRQGEALVLRVADTGPGVPPERRADVLEAFERLDPSRSRRTGGVGLGLALARRIAVAHGGSLTLDEARGDAEAPGLAVTVTLPLGRAPGAGPARRPAGDDSTRDGPIHGPSTA